MFIRGTIAAATLLAASLCGSVQAQAQSDPVAEFYSGKTVEVLIGYSPGGGYDSYGRLLARYLGEHIPGNPTVVAKNMPGAGSLKLMNYLAEVAPKDGTAIGIVGRGIPVEPLLGAEGTRFDAQQMTWIGSLTSETSLCASWKDADVKTWDDLMAPDRKLIVGGTGAASDVEIFTKMLQEMFDAHLELISGYPGSSDMQLAIERGEIEGRCGWSLSTINPEWLKDGTLNVIVQLATKKDPALGDVPLIMDKAETDEQKAVLRLILSRLALARPFVAPPGIPEDRVEALRAAFMETANDPDFLAEAEKQTLEIAPVSGEEVAQTIAEAYDTSAETIERATKLLRGE